MRRVFLTLVFVSCAVVFCCAVCLAQPAVSSTELINNAKLYDGKEVKYSGEAIGDVMARGAFAWANINDGANAVGIWVSRSLAGNIGYTGSYKSIGDAVEVVGTFHRACPEHGGDLDIHAQALRRAAPGRLVRQNLNFDKRNQAFILLGVLLAVWILTLFVRK